MPYGEDELEEIVRDTAIALKLIVVRTGNPYNILTDVSGLVAGFIRRCAEANVFFVAKHCRKLSMQRLINQNPAALKAFSDKMNPALKAFQARWMIKLTLAGVGNFDETGFDMCAFAETGLFMCLKLCGNQVAVPFEQAPHMTLVVGFLGAVRMAMLVVMKGADSQTPSPYHAQLLEMGSDVFLAQPESGWITSEQKLAFFKLRIERGILGTEPCVINVDGHDSNLNNPELHELCTKKMILLCVPPSHTSAAVGGMGTQQCDRPAHNGGPIALLKRKLRRLLKKQFFAAVRDAQLKGKVTIAEILKLIEVARKESFNPALIAQLNADVGYYIDEEGYLQWGLTRLLPAPANEDSGSGSGLAPVLSSFGGRAQVQAFQAKQQAGVDKAKRDIDGVMAVAGVIEAHRQPVVARPTERLDRSANARAHNRHGCVIGEAECADARAACAERVVEAASKKAATERSYWDKHREPARLAEEALVAAGGALETLGVGQLKDLIISRTGRGAKAGSNKDGAVLAEAHAVLLAHSPSAGVPPPPPPSPPRIVPVAEDESEVCPDCGTLVPENFASGARAARRVSSLT